MAKVFFRYAAMNAGKSTQILRVRHNYHERHQATMNARVIDGRITHKGPQVLIGGNSTYIALCRKHWREGRTVPPTD
jgi:thymidine kinase